MGYLAYLREVDPALAVEARLDIEYRLELLARHPGIGRPSRRWRAYREKSLLRWKKIAVYSVTAEFVRVHAFLDARQELDRVRL